MKPHERQRLSYAPHLEYIKELILSEGITQSIPAELERLLESPPTAARDLAANLSRQSHELVLAMEDKLKAIEGIEGFDAYKKSLDHEEPIDLAPWETGPKRADFLFYRALRRTDKALSTISNILTDVVEDDPETEAQRLEKWVRDEARMRLIRQELLRLEPLLVDGSPGAADQAYAEFVDEIAVIEHEMAVRRRNLAYQVAPAFWPGLLKIESMMPRMYDLVYGAIESDIKGDPSRILNILLDAASPYFPSASELKQVLRTVRQALSFFANIRALTARKAVQMFASYIQRPSWDALSMIMREMRRYQREIFWPLFDILELLVEKEFNAADDRLKDFEPFAMKLMEILKSIDEGIDELKAESERFNRFAVSNLETSLDEIEQLKQLEGFAEMLDGALAELDQFPIDLTSERDRRRLVQIIAESRNWGARYGHEAKPASEGESDAGGDSS